jgi:hypothetical protein
VTTYAEFDPRVLEYLADPTTDDTYARPIFSLVLDDENGEDPEHLGCVICHDNRYGNRWVPDNGGAWVNSAVWEGCDRDYGRYLLATANYLDFSW